MFFRRVHQNRRKSLQVSTVPGNKNSCFDNPNDILDRLSIIFAIVLHRQNTITSNRKCYRVALN